MGGWAEWGSSHLLYEFPTYLSPDDGECVFLPVPEMTPGEAGPVRTMTSKLAACISEAG